MMGPGLGVALSVEGQIVAVWIVPEG
jgi:hypothetical protein